jgi:hypothetical protein
MYDCGKNYPARYHVITVAHVLREDAVGKCN